jgi:eukaryotic-like serine/threonine-protein kinase
MALELGHFGIGMKTVSPGGMRTDFVTLSFDSGTHAAQVLAGRRRTLGSQHPDTILSAADLALAYVSQGKFAESEPLAREAFDFDRKKQPEDWHRFRAESLLGGSLAGQKKYADAEPLLLEGYR